MIDRADWYVAIKMLWYDFDSMGLEYRGYFVLSSWSYSSWCCLQEALVSVNWWLYLRIPYL